MSFNRRVISMFSVVVMLLAACGGSDSSSRTKNSALCYATQEEKDAAVKAAQDAFDAAMGNVVIEEQPEGVPTSTTVSEEQPEVISETTVPGLEEAFGSGYRRPAVRAASSGETSTTVSESGDGAEVALTPEQQQAQMDLEAAEAQPLCESNSEGAAEVTCTATIALESVSDDCEAGDVRVDGTQWELVGTDESGAETVFAFGPYDASIITAESPLVFPITYGGSSDGGESASDACTATFTSTSVSWSCPNGELFDVAIEDMSNPGVYPSVSCASSGELTASGTDPYWFNFTLAGNTFFDGWANEREQNVPIEFVVPEVTTGSCTESNPENIDWEALPKSGQIDNQNEVYSFTVPEGFEGPVLIKLTSDDDHWVGFDMNAIDYFYSCWENCPPYFTEMIFEPVPGEYSLEISGAGNISWSANIDLVADPIELPELPFTYKSDGSKTLYTFTLAETQNVTLWATAFETCTVDQDNEEGNGYIDPELELVGPGGFNEDDDNSGRGLGNCSASFMEYELEPGRYFVYVEDDDHEGGDVTLGSSVELTKASVNWKLNSTTASPDTTFEIVVPEGGAWFRALTVINEIVTETYDMSSDDDEPLSATGCVNPDGDLETDDFACPDSFLVLLNANGDEIVSDDDGGEQVTYSISNGIRTVTVANHYASDLSIFLEEGVYTLAVMDCCGPWDEETPSTDTYEVQFGFGSEVAEEAPELEIIADENPTIPQSVEQVKLPSSQLSTSGAVSTSLADGVDTLVCDATCIDGMFASAGITDGFITVSAGGDSVTLRKGQKKALIPISENASSISATVVSTDGTQSVHLSSKITKLSEAMQSSIASKTSASDGGTGLNLMYLLLIIPILGALAVINRRKQSANN